MNKIICKGIIHCNNSHKWDIITTIADININLNWVEENKPRNVKLIINLEVHRGWSLIHVTIVDVN